MHRTLMHLFRSHRGLATFQIAWLLLAALASTVMGQPPVVIQVYDAESPDWQTLGEDDFVRVNGDDETLVWRDGVAYGSGQPIGVTRSQKTYRNFEFCIEWMHEKPGGNSGVFAWVPAWALEDLPPNDLPDSGIEIQMLEHDFTRRYVERTGRTPDWFTTNGDVFAVGKSTMQPKPPVSNNGRRSFPAREVTKGFGEWNQYYVRAINGEIRLWINGVEVSGGHSCTPSQGYLCLESEGSPIQFRNLRIRELP